MFTTGVYRPESRKEEWDRRRSRRADLRVNAEDIRHEAGENLADQWHIQSEHMRFIGPANDKGIVPLEGFADSNLHPNLVLNAQKLFEELAPLQRYTIPIMLEDDHHLLVHAQTGSGKTAAFCLPAIQMVLNWKKIENNTSPLVLIVGNTGSLVHQTFTHCCQFAGYDSFKRNSNTGCTVSILTSGADSRVYRERQTTGDIVIGTMGTIMRELEEKRFSLSQLKLFILDEADKMIDSTAFGRDIAEVYEKHIPEEAQKKLRVAMYSATFETVEKDLVFTDVMQMLFKDVSKINCLIAPKIRGFIDQRLIRIRNSKYILSSENERELFLIRYCAFQKKIRWLECLLKEDLMDQNATEKGPFKSVSIIFCGTKRRCNYVAAYLVYRGIKAAPYSSDYDLMYTNKVHGMLRRGELLAVVSTNKIARGLDVPNVNHVIIFDMDPDFSVYEHRIGRTGRAGNGGKSTLLFDEFSDFKLTVRLLNFLEYHDQIIPKWLSDNAENVQEQFDVRTLFANDSEEIEAEAAEEVSEQFFNN